MQHFLRYLLTGFIFLFTSCGQIPSKDDATDFNEKGIVLINEGNYEEALQAFLKAIKKPDLSRDSKGTIYRNISITCNELNKKDSAIHFSTLASKCYPKNTVDHLVNAADVDLLKGKTAVALAKLLKAVSIDPDEMSVNNTLGLLYLGEYDYEYTDLDKALIYNTRAFELNGSRVIEELLARNYYRLENYEKAELHFENLVQKYPDMISYALELGMAKQLLNKKTEAAALFEKVIAKDSSYKETVSSFIDNN